METSESDEETRALVEHVDKQQESEKEINSLLSIEELISEKSCSGKSTTFMWGGPMLWGFLEYDRLHILSTHWPKRWGSLIVGIVCGCLQCLTLLRHYQPW